MLDYLRWQRIKFQHRRTKSRKTAERWIRDGQIGLTPHAVKQDTIRYYQKTFSVNVLIETGTFRGEMVYAQRKYFKKIISIELSKELCELAQKRLGRYEHVQVLNGDSGKLLRQLVDTIDEPAIFWLDGHYSGFETARGESATPVFQELDAILTSGIRHIMLIDDARLFVGKDDYPTIEELKEFVSTRKDNATFTIENDIIRIY